MINPDNVFVADARPALNVPQHRSAYVFGAAHPLGEALLAQILASSAYTRVYVSTKAALPATVAHLHGMLDTLPFVLQDEAQAVDCILIAADASEDAVPRWGFAARSTVYSTLHESAVPGLLRNLAGAGAAANVTARAAPLAPQTRRRWFIAAPEAQAATVSSWVSTYSAHTPCLVYGLQGNESGAQGRNKSAYQFKPEGSSVLDRLGVWVLNTLSGVVHGMLNPQTQAPLTTVKTAQRLAAQFAALDDVSVELKVVTPADLRT